MSNTTAEKKKLVEVFALWKRKSKDGKKVYFSGKTTDGVNITGFYNTEKKNLKEPDLRVYLRDDEGNLSEQPLVSIWCNSTKNGKKILSGKIDGRKVVGFINDKASEKQPYIKVYWSDDEEATETPSEKPEKKEAPKKTGATKKKEAPKFEEVEPEALPF